MSHQFADAWPGKDVERFKGSQNGSVILIVLMLLVILSIIGVTSTNTTVTENFIVRNSAIRKQNMMMADTVAAEALQQILDAGMTDAAIVNPPLLTEAQINPIFTTVAWVHDDDNMAADAGFTWNNWYSQATGPLLDNANSAISQAVTLNNGTGISEVLVDRGGLAAPPRYALAGWTTVTGGSLKMTSMTRRTARVLVEYMSEDFGVVRLTVGVERWFM